MCIRDRFFVTAEMADRDCLPVFKTDLSELRTVVNALVKRYEPCNNPKCYNHATYRCAGCRQVWHCSDECGRKEWPNHKEACLKHRREMREGKGTNPSGEADPGKTTNQTESSPEPAGKRKAKKTLNKKPNNKKRKNNKKNRKSKSESKAV